VNLQAGTSTLYTTGQYLYHILACQPGSTSKAFGLASSPGADVATFSLTTFDCATGTSTVVATLPQSSAPYYMGFDNIFMFADGGAELWTAFPNAPLSPGSDPAGGVLTIVDTTSGAVKATYTIPWDVGFIWAIFPPAGGLAAALKGATFMGGRF
jgi:hypothetical protein